MLINIKEYRIPLESNYTTSTKQNGSGVRGSPLVRHKTTLNIISHTHKDVVRKHLGSAPRRNRPEMNVEKNLKK